MKKILLFILALGINFTVLSQNNYNHCPDKSVTQILQEQSGNSIQKATQNALHKKKNTISGKDWTILEVYQIPGRASGLAWDGTYLYSGIYGVDGARVYQISPDNGAYTLYCNGPQEDAYGLTHDGEELWTTDHAGSTSQPALAMKFDNTGTQLQTFSLPDHYMSGIAYDSDGTFWVQTYYPDPGIIYNVDNTGSVISQFTAPNTQPWDICVQDDKLWVTDYNANMIYELDKSGNILSSHPSENTKPAGIVYDGQYLWYCDGYITGNMSYLYKIDLSGGGNPVINILPEEVALGNVTINQNNSGFITVYNQGTSDLVVDFDYFTGTASNTLSWGISQVTIAPNENEVVEIICNPSGFTAINAIGHLTTNDPLQPDVEVPITGHSVYDGVYLNLENNSHNYGSMRVDASKMWKMMVQNAGNETLTITDIQSNNELFYIYPEITLPVNIGVMESMEVDVWFHPGEAISYNAEIEIVSNDENSPTIVSLSGSAFLQDWEMGDLLWQYNLTGGWDVSPKGIDFIKDMNADDIQDVVVSSEDYFLRCFNGNSHDMADLIWETEIGTVYNQHGISKAPSTTTVDVEDVILGTTSRSIFRVNGETGEVIWEHQTNDFGDGGWVYQVDAKYDYNNDGKRDVLAAVGDDSNDNGPKRVYCLNAIDGEAIWTCYVGGPCFSVISIEDVNGDGHPDVLAGASDESETQGSVKAINGVNGVVLWTVETNGSSVWALDQLDDINGDGVREVVAGDFSGYYYFIDPANGDVLFEGSTGNSLILDAIVVNDVNNDKCKDVTFARSNANLVMINGKTGANLWLTSLADKAWNVCKTIELNGDAINDLVVGTLYQTNKVYYVSGADGEILHEIDFPSAIDALQVIPDVVGDKSEEALAGGRNGELRCYSGGIDHNIFTSNVQMNHAGLIVSPNPFKNNTMIQFELNEADDLQIRIYDLQGKTVRIFAKSLFSKGTHRLPWNGYDDAGHLLNNGIYFVEISSSSLNLKTKIVLNK